MASKNAKNLSPDAPEMQMHQLKETRKQFLQEQKNQKKEAKKRAKEFESQQRELEEQIDGSSVPVVIVTLFIIIIWLGILCLLIKMDVGGFGSSVLTPLFKDVPIINMILPADSVTETQQESYGGYSSLKDAVDQIERLQVQIEKLQDANATYAEQIETMKAEVIRLQTFEDNQEKFQEVRLQFFEEVVYAENGPGADEYRVWYEEIDPVTAQTLYKQVIQSEAADKEMQEYAKTFSNMDASNAAKILESMTDNLELAAKILETLDVESRGAILGEMDASIAARVAKLMNPNS